MADKKKRIMVATDGSKAGTQAVRYAAALAKRRGTELVILHAVSYKKVGYWAFIDSHFKKEMFAAGQKILEEAEGVARQYGGTVVKMLRESEKLPHVAIVDVLEELKDIWVLVLGDKGQTFEDRHAMGSTTQSVLAELSRREIPVPLLVVPFVADVETTI